QLSPDLDERLAILVLVQTRQIAVVGDHCPPKFAPAWEGTAGVLPRHGAADLLGRGDHGSPFPHEEIDEAVGSFEEWLRDEPLPAVIPFQARGFRKDRVADFDEVRVSLDVDSDLFQRGKDFT